MPTHSEVVNRALQVASGALKYMYVEKSSRASVMMFWVGHELGGQTRSSDQEKVVGGSNIHVHVRVYSCELCPGTCN